MGSAILEENLIDLPPADARLDIAISEKLVDMKDQGQLIAAPKSLVDKTVRQMKREAEITSRMEGNRSRMQDRLDDLKEPLIQGKTPGQASEAFFGSEDVKKYLAELLVLEAAVSEVGDIIVRAVTERPKELQNMKNSVEGRLKGPAGEKYVSDPGLADKILSGTALNEIMPNLSDSMMKASEKTNAPAADAPKQAAPKKPQGRVM